MSTAAGDQHSLVEFAERCADRDIKVYLAPALFSDSAYATTRELLARGVEMIWNVSLESAYAKLLLAYGNFSNPNEIREFLQRELANERVEPLREIVGRTSTG